jgi:hypothetical protein
MEGDSQMEGDMEYMEGMDPEGMDPNEAYGDEDMENMEHMEGMEDDEQYGEEQEM